MRLTIIPLPSGFGSLLGGTGLLNSLGDAARTATAAGSKATRAATSAARAVGETSQRAAGAAAAASSNWLYWLVPIAAAAALLVYFAVRPTEQVAQQGMNNTQDLVVGTVDIGRQITNSVARVRTTLDGVSDVASVQAALPKLQEVATQIDKTGSEVGQLSAEQRKLIAAVINR